MNNELQIYRKRLIPEECILLKDDIIVEQNDDYILTKWKTLNPKTTFSHGCSCYYLKEGFKISKFYRHDGSLLYWYCDIVEYTRRPEDNALIVTDLLADIILYPDGRMHVVDLDELAEALEKWPIDYLEEVVPHLMPIIHELDAQAKKKYKDEKVAIIDKDQRVHMAHMDIHYGFSVNGVAALHTEILKNSELKPFYDIYPEKFNNKTNGITFRRWLMHCNHPLTDYITSLIGDEFKTNATALENLLKYKDDEAVLNKLLEIKTEAKKTCKEFILSNTGVEINENSIYDIQIKRLHEYKRQQLNALYIISKYLEIKVGKKPSQHVTFIFGAKAYPP